MVVFFEKGPENPVPDLSPIGSLGNRGEGANGYLKRTCFFASPD
jgi:hypothetical protein